MSGTGQESVLQFLQGVPSPQVTPQQMQVGQVNQELDPGAWDNEEVTGLPPVVCPEVEQSLLY